MSRPCRGGEGLRRFGGGSLRPAKIRRRHRGPIIGLYRFGEALIKRIRKETGQKPQEICDEMGIVNALEGYAAERLYREFTQEVKRTPDPNNKDGDLF